MPQAMGSRLGLNYRVSPLPSNPTELRYISRRRRSNITSMIVLSICKTCKHRNRDLTRFQTAEIEWFRVNERVEAIYCLWHNTFMINTRRCNGYKEMQ